MKHSQKTFLTFCAVFGLALSGHATVLVNDTWQDGTRSDPASPTYSENGTNLDPVQDTDLESAWFSSSGSALTVPAAGDLRAVQPVNSLTFLTYFTPEGSEVTLSAGDTLKITWVFTPTTVNANNTSLEFPLAIVDTPSGSRRTSDGSPVQAAYAGYAMFMNMGQTLGNSTPFSLDGMERLPATKFSLAGLQWYRWIGAWQTEPRAATMDMTAARSTPLR